MRDCSRVCFSADEPEDPVEITSQPAPWCRQPQRGQSQPPARLRAPSLRSPLSAFLLGAWALPPSCFLGAAQWAFCPSVLLVSLLWHLLPLLHVPRCLLGAWALLPCGPVFQLAVDLALNCAARCLALGSASKCLQSRRTGCQGRICWGGQESPHRPGLQPAQHRGDTCSQGTDQAASGTFLSRVDLIFQAKPCRCSGARTHTHAHAHTRVGTPRDTKPSRHALRAASEGLSTRPPPSPQPTTQRRPKAVSPRLWGAAVQGRTKTSPTPAWRGGGGGAGPGHALRQRRERGRFPGHLSAGPPGALQVHLSPGACDFFVPFLCVPLDL